MVPPFSLSAVRVSYIPNDGLTTNEHIASEQFIAHGAFCAVFSCKYRGFSVVAKRVREDLPRPERRKALENLWQEYDCLQPLQHPNVIEAYDMW